MRGRRQHLRAEETKQAILSAAGKMFAERGYPYVTMREIAKEAGCSHTTIYIYFTDKEALLQELSIPPLKALAEQFAEITQTSSGPLTALKELSLSFIRFGLQHKTMYSIFFMAQASRVDRQPDTELNRIRLELFDRMSELLRQELGLEREDERVAMCSRIYFYMVHGMISTYTDSEEDDRALLSRLSPVFEQALESVVTGIQFTLSKED